MNQKGKIGQPIFKLGDRVQFKFENRLKTGTVEIVDRYGTFEQNEEPSYDVMSVHKGQPCLFKHIRESSLTKTT